jgi:hypothetical protein
MHWTTRCGERHAHQHVAAAHDDVVNQSKVHYVAVDLRVNDLPERFADGLVVDLHVCH